MSAWAVADLVQCLPFLSVCTWNEKVVREVFNMIQFLVTAVIVVIFLFILVVVLALMTWIVTRLLRFLFPQKFAQAAKAMQGKKKKLLRDKDTQFEQRCPSCSYFGSCPAGMKMAAPCRFYAASDSGSGE